MDGTRFGLETPTHLHTGLFQSEDSHPFRYKSSLFCLFLCTLTPWLTPRNVYSLATIILYKIISNVVLTPGINVLKLFFLIRLRTLLRMGEDKHTSSFFFSFF